MADNGQGSGSPSAPAVPSASSPTPPAAPPTLPVTADSTPPAKSWLEFYLKVLPLLLAFGAAFWSGTLFERECSKDKQDFLTLQRDELKTRLAGMDKLEKDLVTANSYRSDLEECRREAASSAKGGDALNTSNAPKPVAGEIDAQIFNGDTLNVSHKLFVTLGSISPGKSMPPIYQASMTLGAPQVNSETFIASAGAVKTFATYEIRVTKIDPVSVWLHIRHTEVNAK